MKRLLLSLLLALGAHALFFNLNPYPPLPLAAQRAAVTIYLSGPPVQVVKPNSIQPLPRPSVKPIEPLKLKKVHKTAPVKPKTEKARQVNPKPIQQPVAPAPPWVKAKQKNAEPPVSARDTGNETRQGENPAVQNNPVRADAGGQRQEVDASPQAGSLRIATPDYRHNPPPEYPLIAVRRNYQGTVILNVLVGIDGSVVDLKIEKSAGHSVLDRNAMATVRNWRFEPARRGATPFAMWVEVPVRYELR